MTDLQTLVKQTSNSSVLKMQQRLHDEVVTLGKQALKWKADYEALQLAFETERDAANLYAKQVAHWMHKHDALLAQQLEASESRDAYAKAADSMAAAHKVERDALKEAARLALDALEETFDVVSNAYVEAIDIWGDFPPRQHRIKALKEQTENHNAAIAALKAVL